MVDVYISIGSNVEKERYIRAALDALAGRFSLVSLSPVYESEAQGFSGEPFYNLVVLIQTNLSVGQLNRNLRAIEYSNGRRRTPVRFSSRTLDLDILTYGDLIGIKDDIKLPRDEITHYSFVLKPLVDIAANVQHPFYQATYGELWECFNQQQQPLSVVDFQWQRRIHY